MAEASLVACEGAPRDLGLDQGVALRSEVRRGLRRLVGGRLRRRSGCHDWRGVGRDLERFYPHLFERTVGLERGARVSRRALTVALARELGDAEDGVLRLSGGSALGAVPARTGRGALIARSFDFPRTPELPLVLRRSRPEGGYLSLDVTLPFLAPSLAGVNEHGLAATVTTIPSGAAHRRECAAPALALVQECLQRCDRVEKAVEWCRARPAGGRASLLLADAYGALVSVVVEGEQRRVSEPSEGVALGRGRRVTLVELDKLCRQPGAIDPERLRAILSAHGDDGRADEDTPCRHGELRLTQGVACLDPAERRIELVRGVPCRAGAAFVAVL